jgi:hypothetical protein
MLWMPPSLIAEELRHCDRTAVNQEETTLHGLDPLMKYSRRCMTINAAGLPRKRVYRYSNYPPDT